MTIKIYYKDSTIHYLYKDNGIDGDRLRTAISKIDKHINLETIDLPTLAAILRKYMPGDIVEII